MVKLVCFYELTETTTIFSAEKNDFENIVNPIDSFKYYWSYIIFARALQVNIIKCGDYYAKDRACKDMSVFKFART